MIRTDPVSIRTAPLTHVSASKAYSVQQRVCYCMYSVQIRSRVGTVVNKASISKLAYCTVYTETGTL